MNLWEVTIIRIVVETNSNLESDSDINFLKDRLKENNICYTIVECESPCICKVIENLKLERDLTLPLLISGDGHYFAEHTDIGKVECLIEYENNSSGHPFCDEVL